MGSATSKAAQKGARKFPTRTPGATPPPQPPKASRKAPPAPSSPPKASFTKDEAIRADSINPGATSSDESFSAAFSARLKQMGVADPHPTFSPSSTAAPTPSSSSSHHPSQFPQQQQAPRPSHNYPPTAADNATLGVLEARRRLQEAADRELDGMGRSGDGGKEFLDVATIRDALALRARGTAAADIEARLGLKRGVVARLGPPGVVASVG